MSQFIFDDRDGGSRRDFFRVAASVAAATACGQSLLRAAAPKIPPIGCLLGTTFEGTLEERLDGAKADGLECVQMAMDCAGLPLMPDEIPADLPGRMHREAAARGIRIASVTGTFNMTHPDPAERQAGLRRLKLIAEACPEMGTNLIHICTGSRNPKSMWGPHPDNDKPDAWRDMTACVRSATDIARQANVILGFETEVGNVVDSAQKARRLLDEIGSPHLKVTFDPANLYHKGEFPRMNEIIEEAFTLLAKDMVMAHAKDVTGDGHAGDTFAGNGHLNYDLYTRLLLKNNYRGPVLLHSLNAEEVPGCLVFLRGKFAAAQQSLA